MEDEYSGLRCTIKIGGASITHKDEFETLNVEVFNSVIHHIKETFSYFEKDKNAGKNLNMDQESQEKSNFVPFHTNQNRRAQNQEMQNLAIQNRTDQNQINQNQINQNQINQNQTDQNRTVQNRFLLVHGAGSYGHFQASNSNLTKQNIELSTVNMGFAETRLSVTKLNQKIMQALIEKKVPCVSVSPFSCGWRCMDDDEFQINANLIKDCLDNDLIPVIHGDAVFRNDKNCNILSGDEIIKKLSLQLNPNYVVFLTNVDGIYNIPPHEKNSFLINLIEVDENGKWKILIPNLSPNNDDLIHTSASTHDTTGGIEKKISDAIQIAAHGIPVFIVKGGTDHALEAMKGNVWREKGLDWNEWRGTMIVPKALDLNINKLINY